MMVQLHCFTLSISTLENLDAASTITILGRPMKENHWVNAVTVTWVEFTLGRKDPKTNAVIRSRSERKFAIILFYWFPGGKISNDIASKDQSDRKVYSLY